MIPSTLQSFLEVTKVRSARLYIEENLREIQQKNAKILIDGTTIYHTPDHFDEGFFKQTVGKITAIEFPKKQRSLSVQSLNTQLPYTYTTVRISQTQFSLIQQFLLCDWMLLDTTVELLCILGKQSLQDSEQTHCIQALPSHRTAVLECARAFKHGRLFADPLFENGTSLYHKWLENSLGHIVADDVYVLPADAGKIHGVATIRQHAIQDIVYWEIPLVCKHPESDKKGVARELLSAIRMQAKKQKIPYLVIGTQGDNIRALRSYIAEGFSPIDTGVTLRHKKS